MLMGAYYSIIAGEQDVLTTKINWNDYISQKNIHPEFPKSGGNFNYLLHPIIWGYLYF